jgi:RimJ/RimL family protein N-acetyltransferase
MTVTKRSVGPITDGALTLRLLTPADLPMTRAWRNQDQIRKWFLNSDQISAEQHQEWFARYRDRDDDLMFIIEEQDLLKRPIGQVSLYAIEWDRRRAKFGRLMIGDEDARGRGFARRAVEILVQHAQDTLGLEELRLEVLPGNAPAIAIYEHCGFDVTEQVDGEIRMVRRFPRLAAE